MNEYCVNEDRTNPIRPVEATAEVRLAYGTARRIVDPVIQAVRDHLRRRRERRELLQLDEHSLHDIGVTVDDVLRITGATRRERAEHLGLRGTTTTHIHHIDHQR